MDCDLIIRNGVCYTGDGGEGVIRDIGIKDGMIAAIGRLDGAAAKKVIDAEGMAVAPGFIDTHSHSDLVALFDPAITNKTAQGVTTDIIGQDGMSLAPIVPEHLEAWKKSMAGLEGQYDVEWDWNSSAEYLDRLSRQKLGPNIAYLVPFGNVRLCVVGLGIREATDAEIRKMADLTEAGIEAGAVGMSIGLIYPPCPYASHRELVEVTRVLAKYGLPFVIHQRSEAADILKSMDEVFAVGRESGCHIHFSHFKVCGKKHARLFEPVMEKLDAAAREMPVSVDQYPYTAGSTTLSVVMPPWAHDGGTEKALLRLKDAEARARMKKDIDAGIPGWDNFVDFAGIDNIFVSFVKTAKNADVIGKSLSQIGVLRGKDPIDATLDLLLEEDMSVGMVNFYGLEEHIEKILAHPLQNVCTDGILGSHPHPRVYGTYPRVLGKYVRERKILDLPTAIHKMTGRPASVFGIKDRGLLREGYRADVVVFDPETVIDTATYEAPKQYPKGIPHVIVNGRIVIENSEVTSSGAGEIVRFSR